MTLKDFLSANPKAVVEHTEQQGRWTIVHVRWDWYDKKADLNHSSYVKLVA